MFGTTPGWTHSRPEFGDANLNWPIATVALGPTSVGSELWRWPGVSPRLWALHADRDIVSAALAACVELDDPDDPRTARVDNQLAHALNAGLASQQERQGSVTGAIHHPPPGGLC
jgi:hypothetical protein